MQNNNSPDRSRREMAQDAYKSRRSNRELLAHTDTASDAERADWAQNSSRDPFKQPDYIGPGARPMRHLTRGPNPIVTESRSRDFDDVQPQNVGQLAAMRATDPPDHENLPTREQYIAEHGPRQPDRSDERTHREAPRVTQPLVSPTQIAQGTIAPPVKTEVTPTGGVKKV